MDLKICINDKKISSIMYILKAFALYSIILNHTKYGELHNIYMQNAIAYISYFGVTLFYIISGYYFKNNKPLKAFLKHKLKTLFLPWFVLGTLYFILPKIPSLLAGGMANGGGMDKLYKFYAWKWRAYVFSHHINIKLSYYVLCAT